MKFVCERCQTRYSIADEKVRGKILKVRCKSCQNVITVREAGLAGGEGLAASAAHAPVSGTQTEPSGHWLTQRLGSHAPVVGLQT